MVRLISGQGMLPAQLDFQVPLRGIDSKQTLQNFTANNSTSISGSNPQTIVVRMNSSKWLNTGSSYFMFDATVTQTTATIIASPRKGVGCFFKSMTILNNGTVIEQIRDYATLDRLINISQIEAGSDNNWDQGYELIANRNTTTGSGTSTTREYTLQPIAGFLSSEMMIPLFALGEIEIRLEVNSVAEAIFNATDTSTTAITGGDFSISNFKYVAELHDMPVSFNRLTQDVINSTGLAFQLATFDTLPFTSTVSQAQSIKIQNNSKSVKSTFAVQRLAANFSSAQAYSYVLDNLSHTQLKIGGDYYPLVANKVGAQQYKEYLKAIQRQGKTVNRLDISGTEYKTDIAANAAGAKENSSKCVVGYDRELFCGTNLVCGEDWSESDITFELTYSSAPTDANRWLFYVYKDYQLTIVPSFNVVVNA